MTLRKEGVLGFAHEMLDYDPRIDIAVKFGSVTPWVESVLCPPIHGRHSTGHASR